MLKSLTAALLLASAALLAAPNATAYQPPPQCMSIDQCCGIEPGFAPCCSVLECPPPLLRCPLVDFDTSDHVQFLGPWVSVQVGSDCSAQACLQTTCCSLDGRWSHCSAVALSNGLCPSEHDDGNGLRITVSATCEVVVEYKPYDCVWNCGWVTYVQGPPVTVRVFQQTSGGHTSSASAAEVPSPCGETAYCTEPGCIPRALASEGLPLELEARQDGDCTVSVSATNPQCPTGTAPGETVHHDAVVADAAVQACHPDLACTCDPVAPAAAAGLPSLDDLFQPCPSVGGCCGIEPAEGGCCGLSCPVSPCPEREVSTRHLFAFVGPHVTLAVHSGCTASVSESGLPCPSLAPERRAFDRTVKSVHVHADLCMPVLDCTCPPMAAAEFQPPVWVEFPVCVTDPCPPQVTCHVRPGRVGLFAYEVSPSCHVTLTQDAIVMCEGLRYEETTYGPVTVVRPYCGPGVQE
jgi:hypothetical protein